MPTCRFVTYGCKVNQYDTQALREDLAARGWREGRDEAAADVCVVNTCTVTEAAAGEALRHIRRLARRPGARVVVTGCMVGSHRDVLESIPGVCLLAPNEAKPRVGRAIAEMSRVQSPRSSRPHDSTSDLGHGTPSVITHPVLLEGDPAETFRLGIRRFAGRSRAYVKVQDGCNLVCSYCIIPQVRGRSRSRPIDEAIEEARRLVAAGFRELVLTGVHLGSFGRDLPGRPRFAALLRRFLEVPGDWRLRLSSIEAGELHGEDIDALADMVRDETSFSGLEAGDRRLRMGDCGLPIEQPGTGGPGCADVDPQSAIRNPKSPRLCPHVHLPLQSGSPSVLRRMRRPYTLEQFERKVEALRARMPDAAITTDLIVGFPGETEADFEATLAAARRLAFSRVHVFPYSTRRGTEAARMPGALSSREIRLRARALSALARETAAAFHRRFVGRAVEVLVEDRPDRRTGRPVGYSEHYVRVLLEPGAPASGLAPARVTAADAAGAEGTALRSKLGAWDF